MMQGQPIMPKDVTPQKIRCTGHLSDGSGRQCEKWAMHGRTKCYKHGGASRAAGPDHPRFIHGRYSQHMPSQILALYHQGLRDPRLLEMGNELAALDGRAAQLLARVRKGESPERWDTVREATRAILSYQATDDQEGLTGAISELSKAVFAGDDYAAWSEVLKVWDSRRKIANTERQRLQAAQQTVTQGQLMAFASGLSAIILGRVTDPIARAEISEDIRRMLTREGMSSDELPEAEAM